MSSWNAQHRLAPALALVVAVAACRPTAIESPPPPASGGYYREAQRPAPVATQAPATSPDDIPPDRQANPRFSADTAKERRFADFLRDKSGGLVRQAAVGIEKTGKLRVQLSQDVEPDDTLPLTKSILAGARKDFANQPFTLYVNDPAGKLILRAVVDRDGDVRYRLADDPAVASAKDEPATSEQALARGGVTERDRQFAAWAERQGKEYLRYVQADLERNGRLWFGVTRSVAPGDVRDLTQALLEGARKEFPRREVVATVFDPKGERIGKARLARGGEVEWDR